jgi:hypothetical protein
MLGEPSLHGVDEGAVAEWVERPRGDLRDGGRLGGAEGGHGDHGAHHEIDRDHVDRPLGYAGELLQ